MRPKMDTRTKKWHITRKEAYASGEALIYFTPWLQRGSSLIIESDAISTVFCWKKGSKVGTHKLQDCRCHDKGPRKRVVCEILPYSRAIKCPGGLAVTPPGPEKLQAEAGNFQGGLPQISNLARSGPFCQQGKQTAPEILQLEGGSPKFGQCFFCGLGQISGLGEPPMGGDPPSSGEDSSGSSSGDFVFASLGDGPLVAGASGAF